MSLAAVLLLVSAILVTISAFWNPAQINLFYLGIGFLIWSLFVADAGITLR